MVVKSYEFRFMSSYPLWVIDIYLFIYLFIYLLLGLHLSHMAVPPARGRIGAVAASLHHS